MMADQFSKVDLPSGKITLCSIIHLERDGKLFVYHDKVGEAVVTLDVTKTLYVSSWIRYEVDYVHGKVGTLEKPYDARQCLRMCGMPKTIAFKLRRSERRDEVAEFHVPVLVPNHFDRDLTDRIGTSKWGFLRMDESTGKELMLRSGREVEVWVGRNYRDTEGAFSSGWVITEMYGRQRKSGLDHYEHQRRIEGFPSRPTSLLNFDHEKFKKLAAPKELVDVQKSKGSMRYELGDVEMFVACRGVVLSYENFNTYRIWSGDADMNRSISITSKNLKSAMKPGSTEPTIGDVLKFDAFSNRHDGDFKFQRVERLSGNTFAVERCLSYCRFQTVALHWNDCVEALNVFRLYSAKFGYILDVHRILVPCTDRHLFLVIWIEALEGYPGYFWKVSPETDVVESPEGFLYVPTGHRTVERDLDFDETSSTAKLSRSRSEAVSTRRSLFRAVPQVQKHATHGTDEEFPTTSTHFIVQSWKRNQEEKSLDELKEHLSSTEVMIEAAAERVATTYGDGGVEGC